MDLFEYRTVAWSKRDDGSALTTALNQLGRDGWEAVGMVSRSVTVPMPGMGAEAVPEIIVLLKRRATA